MPQTGVPLSSFNISLSFSIFPSLFLTYITFLDSLYSHEVTNLKSCILYLAVCEHLFEITAENLQYISEFQLCTLCPHTHEIYSQLIC